MSISKKSRPNPWQTLLLFIATLVVFLYYIVAINNDENNLVPVSSLHSQQNLLINGSRCKIPDFDVELGALVHNGIESCSHSPSISYVNQNFEDDLIRISINGSVVSETFKCTYRNIYWDWKEADGGHTVNFGQPQPFSASMTVIIPPAWEFVEIECSNDDKILKEMHAFARRKTLPKFINTTKERWNVILHGIDSISRLNFMRAMPTTYTYLAQQNDWFELQGYNKIAENTYPNLMAVLTGLAPHDSFKCASKLPGKMETCPFVWNDFKQQNYSTMYAEDMYEFSTFHNGYAGFIRPPTDYYFRPFTIALEQGSNVTAGHICQGNHFYIDYIQNWALDLIKVQSQQQQPYFGLFWSNSFSHSTAEIPRVIDTKVQEHLVALTENQHNVIVFLSDHGIRYGPTRFTESGYFEERLPFLYIYLPPLFQQQHPDFAENMKNNKNKLISPYDLHLTLKHILALMDDDGAGAIELTPPKGCSTCQSLLLPIDDRTCPAAGIDVEFWCSCMGDSPYEHVDNEEAQAVVQFVMGILQQNAAKMFMCAKPSLKSVRSVRRTILNGMPQYIVQWETSPGTGIYEAMLKKVSDKDTFEMIGEYSRLSWYENEAYCVDSSKYGWMTKKSCYCTFMYGSSVSCIVLLSSALLICILSAISYVIYRRNSRKRNGTVVGKKFDIMLE